MPPQKKRGRPAAKKPVVEKTISEQIDEAEKDAEPISEQKGHVGLAQNHGLIGFKCKDILAQHYNEIKAHVSDAIADMKLEQVAGV